MSACEQCATRPAVEIEGIAGEPFYGCGSFEILSSHVPVPEFPSVPGFPAPRHSGPLYALFTLQVKWCKSALSSDSAGRAEICELSELSEQSPRRGSGPASSGCLAKTVDPLEPLAHGGKRARCLRARYWRCPACRPFGLGFSWCVISQVVKTAQSRERTGRSLLRP
jgi:hypothetical protein